MPMSLTLVLEYETSTLHCSYERVVTKDAGEAAHAFLPHEAMPAAMLTRSCSAMPTSTDCWGY